MTEKKGKRKAAGKWNRFFHVILALLLVTGMFTGTLTALGWERVYAADSSTDNRKLQNGSFEEGQTWTGNYSQPDQSAVPSWNTTAFQGKIELFKKNTGTYIAGVTLEPTAGTYAAELNADEESTLYQNVKTTPSSVYEWGLDHGARNGADTMALVIGPKQSVDPSKPSKDGRDQLMQMVDWLIAQGMTSFKTSAGLGEQLTVYSKKFAASGTFEDNAGNNAFSLTPSTIYTEEWHIWIMASSKATSGTNPWNSYGSNAEGSAGSGNGSGSTTVDLSKYYLYTVPAGQTDTLFGFVSVGYVNSPVSDDKAKTYGNFLDNINFDIYYPLTASSTAHGTGRVLVNHSHICEVTGGTESGTKYAKEDTFITLQAETVDNKSYFVGVYYTEVDEDGTTQKRFIQYNSDSESEQWSVTDGEGGKKLYTYDSFTKMNAPIDIHFVFIQNPTITYDPNGGQPYYCDLNALSSGNTYDFTPENNGFKKPYISHAAEGYDGWKFMGWLLTGDGVTVSANGIIDENNLLAGEHSIACNYSTEAGSQPDPKQEFVVVDSATTFTSQVDDENKSVKWNTDSESKTYTSKGLTLIAQWRWRQAFIPQVKDGGQYTNSSAGGTVTIKDRESDSTNYDSNYEGVGKAYFAKTNDTVTVEAMEEDNYTFEGWYDSNGNLITTKRTYSYDVTKGSVNTYYARFSGNVTQTYIRQIKNGDNWEDTTDDKIGTLGRYTYTDAAGMPISSTATAGTGYKFVGWYDSTGNKVADNMLINDGATLSYTTIGNATYYARFETTYTVKFAAQTKQANGSFQTDNVGGKVSVASVTDVDGAAANSKATANSGYKFLGWYDKDGKQLSTNATYSTTTTSATNGVTYYARFEIVYNPTVESQVYLSFVAESEKVGIPAEFSGRNAGTGINAEGYGLDNKFGNTISTGFKYSLNTMTDVSTIQITVTVPDSAYVKVDAESPFTGNGTTILTDSNSVQYNKGSIQQISGATTLTYYWDASGLEANTYYGFIIDNLYAPGATATITVNGTAGTKVTNTNGVVNTSSGAYRENSHYPK